MAKKSNTGDDVLLKINVTGNEELQGATACRVRHFNL